MKTISLIDTTLLNQCLYALNMIPNTKLPNGTTSYQIGSKLDEVVRLKSTDSALEELIDKALESTILALIKLPVTWHQSTLLGHHVKSAQDAVLSYARTWGSDVVDRYNFHMDMLDREDLVIHSNELTGFDRYSNGQTA